jgi:hypothetical protein
VRLRPFFSFYGAKWRTARRYPAPTHSTIVEPFAGSAGYAGNYSDRQVVLVDADETIAGLWSYLINVSAAEIRALPDRVEHTDDVVGPQEARSLIGFWLNKGAERPRHRPSAWMRRDPRPGICWGAEVRDRIAEQVEHIRHWRVLHGDYTAAPDVTATWLIDPPYVDKGRRYRRRVTDHGALGMWCRERSGQVIVCEQDGATWLPFAHLADAKSTRGTSREVVWHQEAA